MRPVPILPPQVRKKRKRRSWLLSLFAYGFACLGLLAVPAAGVGLYFLAQVSRDLPDSSRLAKYEPPVMTRVHAADGTLMAEYARERRIFVPINVVPKTVIQAFLAAEDKRFYEHGGVDPMGIFRALYKNLKSGGKRLEGASTI